MLWPFFIYVLIPGIFSFVNLCSICLFAYFLSYLCSKFQNMRICITLLLFVVFLFLRIQTVAVDACPNVSRATRAVMPLAEQTTSSSHHWDGLKPPFDSQAVEYADAHTLAYRLCLSAQRMNRFSSLETFSYLRHLLRYLALRLASLSSSQIHSNDVASTLSWHFACEHYVFGMRRLLL